MTTSNTKHLGTFVRDANREARIAARKMLAAAAQKAYQDTYHFIFQMRAREMGGVNARTRPIITAEATAAAKNAGDGIYLRAGYTHCADPMGADCTRMASPGFSVCPFCGDSTGNPLTINGL